MVRRRQGDDGVDPVAARAIKTVTPDGVTHVDVYSPLDGDGDGDDPVAARAIRTVTPDGVTHVDVYSSLDGDGDDPVAGRAIPRPGDDRVWADDWLSPNVVEGVEGDEAGSVAGAPGDYSLRKVFEPGQVDGSGDADGPDRDGRAVYQQGDELELAAAEIGDVDDSASGFTEPALLTEEFAAAEIGDVDSRIVDQSTSDNCGHGTHLTGFIAGNDSILLDGAGPGLGTPGIADEPTLLGESGFDLDP